MHDGKNQSVGKGHTKRFGGLGCGPLVANPCCRPSNTSLDVCIFAHFKVNCEVMPPCTFANLISNE